MLVPWYTALGAPLSVSFPDRYGVELFAKKVLSELARMS
jgi:hypothetical protein